MTSSSADPDEPTRGGLLAQLCTLQDKFAKLAALL
jgi:hypothetical protein